MKLSKHTRVFALSILLSSLALSGFAGLPVHAQAADGQMALQRGYRTGYSDGYMAGYRDTIDSVAKSYSRHPDYTKASRAFNKEYGDVEVYRDGYQQGFESGYDTGYERRSFESSLPSGLRTRGVIAATATEVVSPIPDNDLEAVVAEAETVTLDDQPEPEIQPVYRSNSNAVIIIPRDTDLILELQEDLNTQNSREGQLFTAKIVSPSEIAGAVVEGRVSKVQKAGKLKRRSELLLSFDRIVISNERWSNFSAVLTEVMPIKGDNVNRVDVEGTAVGRSSLKQDLTKVGGATGAGLVTGALVGGPVGAAVGASVGAAFGVGAVVIQRGKHIRLDRNQQLRIKTAYETQIR